MKRENPNLDSSLLAHKLTTTHESEDTSSAGKLNFKQRVAVFALSFPFEYEVIEMSMVPTKKE